MKIIVALIILFVTGFAFLQPQQPVAIKYANVEIEAKNTAEWLRKPIKNIVPVQSNSGNAFYVTEGAKIKIYVMDELPKPLNTAEIMAAVEVGKSQTGAKVNEDKIFNLKNRTPTGEMSIDLWGHSRKVVDVNGKRVTLITADQIYIAPTINNTYFYTILEGFYKAGEPILRKAYLVHLRYNQVPAIFQSRVWTEGASSVIKVNMEKPKFQQIKIGNKTAPIGSYPTIGFVDLPATAKAKPNPNQVYYIKYQLKGLPVKFGLPIQITIPGKPNDPGIHLLGCPVCPVKIGYDEEVSTDGKGGRN